MAATQLPKLKVMGAFCTRAGLLICAPVLAVVIGASPSMAQSDAPSKPNATAPALTKDEVNALSGLTVTARRTSSVSELTVTVPLCPPAKDQPDPDAKPPKLLSSYPTKGATVRRGLFILRLTFDKPMTCVGLLNNRKGYLNPCPAPLYSPMFSRDRRTFLTVCRVNLPLGAVHNGSAPHRGPGLYNPAFDPNAGVAADFGLRLEEFTSLSGQPLAPSDLNFKIDPNSRLVETMQEAMAQDEFLRDAQKLAMAQRQIMVRAPTSVQPAETPPSEAVAPVQMLAQPQPAQTPPAQPGTPATPVSPLTVEGTPRKVLEQQAHDFVEAYAAPTRKLGLLARWNQPACVVVTGLVAEQAAQFKTRIEAVAKAVRAPVAPPKCMPNIEIVFTPQPQRYLDAAAAKSPVILGDRGAKTVTRPIQAWYATGDVGQPARAPGPAGDPVPRHSYEMTNNTVQDRFNLTRGAEAPRRCVDPGATPHSPMFMSPGFSSDPDEVSAPRWVGDAPCLHSLFLNVLIVVDAAHMGDVSADLASDYLALVALSQPQPRSLDGCLALPSVLDFYARDCPGREAPTGLTPADRAYLTGLYAADLTQVQFGQGAKSEIAGRMVKILDNGKTPGR